MIIRTMITTTAIGSLTASITVDGDAQFACHVAGHLENGEDSISDPFMGGLV